MIRNRFQHSIFNKINCILSWVKFSSSSLKDFTVYNKNRNSELIINLCFHFLVTAQWVKLNVAIKEVSNKFSLIFSEDFANTYV